MDLVQTAALLLIVAVASYAQTVTGFALGLVLLGGVGLTGVIRIDDAALLVTILIVVNAGLMLHRHWRYLAMRACALSIGSSLVCCGAGYALLRYLETGSAALVKLALGVVIVLSALPLMLRPAASPRVGSDASFLAYGAVAGLMGGLFATPGPPLVYHFYRQPLRGDVVRVSLVTIFAVIVGMRLAIVVATGGFPTRVLWWSVLTVPTTIIVTWLADRWRPPIGEMALRRVAFGLLLVSGLALAAPPLLLFW